MKNEDAHTSDDETYEFDDVSIEPPNLGAICDDDDNGNRRLIAPLTNQNDSRKQGPNIATRSTQQGRLNMTFEQMLAMDAFFFDWISHPCYKKYRSVIKNISDSYTTCPPNIDGLVMGGLKNESMDRVFVCVDPLTNLPLKKRIYCDSKQKEKVFLGDWREATKAERFEIFADRFLEDHKEERRKVTSTNSVGNREQICDISRMHIIPGWKHHPGTTFWLEVVKSFSDDTEHFPKWEDSFAGHVMDAMRTIGAVGFLVVLNSNGNPCISMSDAKCYEATDQEIVCYTKQQFLKNRRIP